MSFILEALRKSQQARQPGPAPEFRGAVHDISLSMPGVSGWLVLGVILLLGMTIAALVFWRDIASGVPATPVETSAPVAPVTGPVPAATEVVPVAPVAPRAEAPAESTIPVHDLAEQARVPVRVVPKSISLAHTEGKAQVQHRSVAKPAAVVAPSVPDTTPLLQQMPTDFQHTLPPLKVSIHVYAPDPAQRILFINNRQYRQGDLIDGEVRVEEIVPDGVILSYHGERFKLGRPR